MREHSSSLSDEQFALGVSHPTDCPFAASFHLLLFTYCIISFAKALMWLSLSDMLLFLFLLTLSELFL